MLPTILQTIETVAVLVGVIFGLIQLRRLRLQQEVQGGAELLRTMHAPDTVNSAMLLYGLPDDLSTEDLKARLGDKLESVLALGALYEGMGPLVARGHVPIDMYADFYRGSTILCWRKLRRYVEEQRQCGWTNLFEWFQWLAEKMDSYAPMECDTPAYERFKDWRNEADYRRLRAR